MKFKITDFFPSDKDFWKFLGLALLVSVCIAVVVGSVSAFFLTTLQASIDYRYHQPWILYLLPIGGFLIGLLYHYYGASVAGGNNQVITAMQKPKQQPLPLIMATFVYIGTIFSHLFGASAGREGTAVQMGASISAFIGRFFPDDVRFKRVVLTCGVSAGFAGVFGTPIAGVIFAYELFSRGKAYYYGLIPTVMAALGADYICLLWGAHHTHYDLPQNVIADIGPLEMGYAALAGIFFGFAGRIFVWGMRRFSELFHHIGYPPLRPLVGGILVVALTFTVDYFFQSGMRYNGLGIPVIEESFRQPSLPYDFAFKILFTTLTLGAGYKGGEVTPLFFTGATLGSALSLWLPLDYSLLAGMGFVAVFAAAANTPFATVFMGIELFGAKALPYFAIACFTAYIFSGPYGIYTTQKDGVSKQE